MYAIKYDAGFSNLVIIPNATGREVPIDKTFSNDEELRKLFSGPELAALYNAVGGDDPILKVKRFKDRADGAKRTYGMISRLHPEVPEAAAPSTASPTSAANSEKEGADMATKKTKKAKGPKRVKKTKIERQARVKGEVREGTIAAEVVKMWSRERGATHLEALEVVKAKFPGKKAEALHNTLRGCVNSIPKSTGRKLKKTKDEKRGLVYNLV